MYPKSGAGAREKRIKAMPVVASRVDNPGLFYYFHSENRFANR
jgi:hypothetical protein